MDYTFENVIFRKSETDSCKFSNCQFCESNFIKASYTYGTFKNCSFLGGNLRASEFAECKFINTKFKNGKFEGIIGLQCKIWKSGKLTEVKSSIDLEEFFETINDS